MLLIIFQDSMSSNGFVIKRHLGQYPENFVALFKLKPGPYVVSSVSNIVWRFIEINEVIILLIQFSSFLSVENIYGSVQTLKRMVMFKTKLPLNWLKYCIIVRILEMRCFREFTI
jgi:hypothetical protein